MVRRLVDQLEAGALVNPPRSVEDVVCPEDELAVAGGPREVDACVDELRADTGSARAGLDEEDAQLRDVVRLAHAEHAADADAAELGDPAALAHRIVLLCEYADDRRDESFEGLVPAVLRPVERAVALDDPAVVAGARRAQPDLAARFVAE